METSYLDDRTKHKTRSAAELRANTGTGLEGLRSLIWSLNRSLGPRDVGPR